MEYAADSPRVTVKNRVAPPVGGVKLTGGKFAELWKNNLSFLKKFDVDRMLYWFRMNAGQDAPGVPYGYDAGHFENNLHGQTAGEFLMGAGSALLWREDAELRQKLDEVVRGIGECRAPDGYLLPVPKEHFNEREYPNYVRAWLTFGLLAAGAAGNGTAYRLARGMGDWFNTCFCLPYVKDMNLGFQGILANLALYLSPVGKAADFEVAQRYYREDWWLRQLKDGDQRAIYQHPGNHPHGTLLTALEGCLDMYRATGEPFLLESVRGALRMYEEKWQHVGGGIVMCEEDEFYPGCNFLSQKHKYNELCCTTFWVLLNQRMHLLEPDDAHFADEMEESVYNVLAAAQVEDRGLHYLAFLEGCKDMRWTDRATCCAATGSRLIAMLPQLLYSFKGTDIYCDLYADSEAVLGGTELLCRTGMPYSGEVHLTVKKAERPVTLHLRVPSWCASPVSAMGRTARPGSWLVLENVTAGAEIDFTLPFSFRAKLYSGAEELPGKQRWALSYGPLLLALMGRGDVAVHMDPACPEDWLIPKGAACFRVKENPGREYRPYMDIVDEPFTVYPVVR